MPIQAKSIKQTTIRGISSDNLIQMEERLLNLRYSDTCSDKWAWAWDKKGSFSVNRMANLIKESQRSSRDGDTCFFWSNLIPTKINIFIWRFLRDALPTRSNLAKRGISLQSLACIFCDNNVETLDHCLFTCPSSSIIWKKIWAWWDLKSHPLSSAAMFKMVVQQMGQNRGWGKLFIAVCAVAIWQIWK